MISDDDILDILAGDDGGSKLKLLNSKKINLIF